MLPSVLTNYVTANYVSDWTFASHIMSLMIPRQTLSTIDEYSNEYSRKRGRDQASDEGYNVPQSKRATHTANDYMQS
jgi:hypothetical protein